MAIDDRYRARAANVLEKIDACKHLTDSEKDDMRDMMGAALDGTNGLSMEEKIQSNALNIFNLQVMMFRQMLKLNSCKTWREVVCECRWPIVIVLVGAIVLLGFHPELAGILEKFHR